MIAEVVVDVNNNQVNKVFDYLVPQNYLDIIDVGYRVKVGFGYRKVLGFIVNLKEESDYEESKLKYIDEILDLKPIITKEFISLSSYMVDKYYTFYITALKTMIPNALKVKYLKRIHLLNSNGIDDEILSLFKNDYYTVKKNDNIIPKLSKLIKDNKIEVIDDFVDNLNIKTTKMVSLVDSELKYSSKKAQMVIDYLEEIGEDVEKEFIISEVGITDAVLKTLKEKGNINIYDYEIYRNPYIKDTEDKKVILNEKQSVCYEEIKKSLNKNDKYLLHGVCGSGKTEIYLNLIEDVINANKEAILLVPEISLTPQMTQRFKARFKDLVAVLHSRLSQGEKYDEWRRIINGQAKIVVGARSAIFAPFNNLGLIIIDEEHETSYIQDTNPKYDAIDIASWRCDYHKCPLVLGSATPRITSYHKAMNKEYKLLELKERANGMPEPIAKIVDMREELKAGNKKIFSRDLLEALNNTYKKGEQSILFLNKRGFSTFVMCRMCGSVIKCPNCDVTMTYHKNINSLICHYCGEKMVVPTKCPTCNSSAIKYVGNGTEQIVEAISKEIPGARVLRIDTDTTKEKNSYERMYDEFKEHKADILVGTQIIAKGLDFPLVTLVGVVNADIGLKIPTYNSAELTYDLIDQVSGRAGRDKISGNVFIQTYNPDHYAIKYASVHDYKGFYNEEIRTRRIASYPPYSVHVQILVSSSDRNKGIIEAQKIATNLRVHSTKSIILGPAQDFRYKINNMYRYVITAKFSEDDIKDIMLYINERYQNDKDVIISITRM